MPGSNNGDTSWFASSATPTRFTTSDFFVPSGVKIRVSAAASFGNRATVTHLANATTDGFPMVADTWYEVPPAVFDGNLKNLYVVAGGAVNVHLMFPRKDASL